MQLRERERALRARLSAAITVTLPSWAEEWSEVAESIRRAPGRVFWELFSGDAGLSAAFLEEGWWVGTPVDIVSSNALDLLNMKFFMLVMGLILEGRVAVLHMGPPCS